MHGKVRPRTIRKLPFVGVQDLDVRGLASQPRYDIACHYCRLIDIAAGSFRVPCWAVLSGFCVRGDAIFIRQTDWQRIGANTCRAIYPILLPIMYLPPLTRPAPLLVIHAVHPLPPWLAV